LSTGLIAIVFRHVKIHQYQIDLCRFGNVHSFRSALCGQNINLLPAEKAFSQPDKKGGIVYDQKSL